MKSKTFETIGYLINGLSIFIFFYLASSLKTAPVALPIVYLAWAILGIGVVLIVLSIIALAGNRESGLVERGIFGIVRHPMYLGAMLAFFSWILFFPHWIIIVVSLVNIAIVYWFILQGEHLNIEKFGDAYRRYMEKVPRINILAGLFKAVHRKM